MRRLSILFLTVWLVSAAYAQVTTTPSIIEEGYTGQVVITYDPTKGNGGMAGATKCYAHTGLITSASKSTGDWKHTVSTWRAANTPQLTKVGDKWQLIIPNIYTFYNVPTTTKIIALAFVFHDGPGGSKEGKTAGGSDILIFIGEENTGDIWDNFTPAACQQARRPSGLEMGITYPADQTQATLCMYAANKAGQPAQHVFLIGDMTNWKLSNDYQLKRDGNYFWITLENLEPGKQYRFQYAVVRADGVKKQLSDAFAEIQLHPDDAYEPTQVWGDLLPQYPMRGPDGGYVSILQTAKSTFAWSQETLNFQRPDKNNLIIYEVWTYDYTSKRCFAGLMDRLDYIQNLGVNALELMPVCEFDGNYNWGYSPNHYFAVDKAYGTPEEFKTLIDECHKRGIAVIMDMVFNHATGLNPMNKLYPYGNDLSQNPWFNVSAPHSDNVYEDWNHDFQPTRQMFIRALNYWLTEYKVDGYRMDLSHGFCGANCTNLMNNIATYYNQGVKAVSEDAYFILEHWGSSMNTQRPQLIQQGMLCWNNTNNAYNQTAMGYLSNGDAFTDANKDGYVSYCESHDEERNFYKARTNGKGLIKTDESVRLARIAMNTAFNVLLNGPHMIWQYQEVGYDFSINSSYDKPASSSSNNRTSIKPRAESYGYFHAGPRMQQRNIIAAVCHLRTHLLPTVFAGDPTAVSISSGKVVRTIEWGTGVQAVFVAGNFSPDSPQQVTLPSGTWYDYLNGGTQVNASTMMLAPGELVVLTGAQLAAPVLPDAYEEFTADIPFTPASHSSSAQKVLRDGQLYIIHNDIWYNLQGTKLK
ncbi:MAG: hypothetical protein J5635_03905 [Paludibacteraceae bacterium]|nr:hypothetical protein [Paludibacteraceae bacterium]